MDEAQLWGSPVVKNQLSGFKNHFQPPAVAFRKLLIPEISVRLNPPLAMQQDVCIYATKSRRGAHVNV